MSKIISIDLGSTNSVMAYIHNSVPQIIRNADHASVTPSVVHITEQGHPIVGSAAILAGSKEPEHTIFSIKRFIGRQFKDPEIQQHINRAPYKITKAPNGEVEIILRGRPYTPTEISAFILKAMKRDAEAALGEDVTHAVLTVPAYFTQHQREVILEAGRVAGLDVVRIINESAAASLVFGFGSGVDEPQTILVYDLGGGTFDVTVVRVQAGMCNVLAIYGDMHLGGDTFDEMIVELLVEKVRTQYKINVNELHNNNEVLFTLKHAAEEAKMKLSASSSTLIVIPGLVYANEQRVDLECELSRDLFNSIIQPYVNRSIELGHEAIRWAGIELDDIKAVLLVGGSTHVPLVRELLQRVFGNRIICDNINPMHCVALGAAILAVGTPQHETTSKPRGKSPTKDSVSPRVLRVFLCHSSNDKPVVRDLYRRLIAEKIDPWLDEEKLLPGQDWNEEIRKAVKASDVVIVCLSRVSINKAGYVQREIQYALDVAQEQPEGTIFLIPLKLEECEVPGRLRRWQWVNYFDKRGYERLIRALQHRASTLGIAM